MAMPTIAVDRSNVTCSAGPSRMRRRPAHRPIRNGATNPIGPSSAMNGGSIAGSAASVAVESESALGSEEMINTNAATTNNQRSFHFSAQTPRKSSTPYAARMSPM
jgi:hypothetical protein